MLAALVARKHAGGRCHNVGLPPAEQIGLALLLAADLGRPLLPAEDVAHDPRLELGTELATLTQGDTLLLDLSYLMSLPVQDLGRTTL